LPALRVGYFSRNWLYPPALRAGSLDWRSSGSRSSKQNNLEYVEADAVTPDGKSPGAAIAALVWYKNKVISIRASIPTCDVLELLRLEAGSCRDPYCEHSV